LYQHDSGNIIGVISTNPGFVGGVAGPDKVLVALTGQVPMQVNNESGMIMSGDTISFSTSNWCG